MWSEDDLHFVSESGVSSEIGFAYDEAEEKRKRNRKRAQKAARAAEASASTDGIDYRPTGDEFTERVGWH